MSEKTILLPSGAKISYRMGDKTQRSMSATFYEVGTELHCDVAEDVFSSGRAGAFITGIISNLRAMANLEGIEICITPKQLPNERAPPNFKRRDT